MNIAELLSNEELRRHEFPVAALQTYLAHAGVCPLPRRAADAAAQCALLGTQTDQEKAMPATVEHDARVVAACLLGAQPEEVALVGPTSLGLSFVAGGLPWRPGDNVLVYRDDYPSNVYPWMALAAKGVELRSVRARELGEIHADDVLAQVDGRTRMVALASCHFIGGWRIDLATIGAELRRRGVLFCVDGIQTLGAFPTPVEHVDLLAADAHKWLLGPCAAGIFYVRREVQARLAPSVYGWHNVLCPGFVAQESLVFHDDARRYEAGTANLLGIVGMKAAMELLLETGIDRIAAELLRKRARLVPALQSRGWTVLHADAPPQHAGSIVSFRRPGEDMAARHRALAAEKIITSLRTDRAGREFIRISPHFYNTDDELDRLLERL